MSFLKSSANLQTPKFHIVSGVYILWFRSGFADNYSFCVSYSQICQIKIENVFKHLLWLWLNSVLFWSNSALSIYSSCEDRCHLLNLREPMYVISYPCRKIRRHKCIDYTSQDISLVRSVFWSHSLVARVQLDLHSPHQIIVYWFGRQLVACAGIYCTIALLLATYRNR